MAGPLLACGASGGSGEVLRWSGCAGRTGGGARDPFGKTHGEGGHAARCEVRQASGGGFGVEGFLQLAEAAAGGAVALEALGDVARLRHGADDVAG